MAKTDWKGSLGLALSALALFGGAVWTLAFEFSKIDKHISRVETAVRIVGAKQSGDTKTLVDEALTVAKNAADAGRAESAKNILGVANRLLAEQAALQEPAPQEFFDSAIQKYQKLKKSPELNDAAWDGAFKLVEYRSATTSAPPGSFVHIGEMGQKAGFQYLKNSVISGQNAIRIPGCDGFNLDGWYLDNVVFQNVTICYRGGLAVLSNVHFVNCRFDVVKSSKTDPLIEAIVKQPANVALG